MKKGTTTSSKNPRKRKIEGLSIFDSEIAAPSDYGDFMRVDAPVSVRATEDLPVQSPAAIPAWEQFKDFDDALKPNSPLLSQEVPSNDELGTNQVQSLVSKITGYKLGTKTPGSLSNEVQTGYSPLEENPVSPPHKHDIDEARVPVSGTNWVQTRYTAPESPTPNPTVSQITGYKPGTKLGTNGVQTKYKVGTEFSKTGYKKVDLSKKLGTQLGTEVGTNEVQTGYKKTFGSLRGVQRKIILFLFEASLNNRNKITGSISIEHLALSCETSVNTAKVSIKRLKNEGLLQKVEFGNGRGGWTSYALPDLIYNELLQERSAGTNQAQTGYKLSTQSGTQSGTEPSSSSSFIKDEEIKTNIQGELPSEWAEIDFSFLSEDPIRFGYRDLLTLYKLNLFKAVDIERALKEFHFDITQNKKPYGRGALFGVLRKGNLWVAPGYEPEEERLIREQVKALEARQRSKQELQERLEELKFQEWVSGLSMDEKRALSPYTQNETSPLFATALKNHYLQNLNGDISIQEVRKILDQELGPL